MESNISVHATEDPNRVVIRASGIAVGFLTIDRDEIDGSRHRIAMNARALRVEGHDSFMDEDRLDLSISGSSKLLMPLAEYEDLP